MQCNGYSILGYICSYLTFEFKLMELDWRVGLPGYFAKTFAGQVYIGQTSIFVVFSFFWFSMCRIRVSLQRCREAYVVYIRVSPNSSTLWIGLYRCIFAHHPNCCESITAFLPGATSDVCNLT